YPREQLAHALVFEDRQRRGVHAADLHFVDGHSSTSTGKVLPGEKCAIRPIARGERRSPKKKRPFDALASIEGACSHPRAGALCVCQTASYLWSTEYMYSMRSTTLLE